ncbi:MAG: hypothetical protein IJT54_05920 [Candidatus Methanomethylophilaceae archaeon]|nr:hypothetical protein [Candidatus Methanomethylophilaceae archaeon]
MTERTNWTDIALYVSGEKTLAEYKAILEKLNDYDVDIMDVEFEDNGAFLEARYLTDEVKLEDLKGIEGLEVDWDTMSEWDDCEVDGE